MSQTNITSIKPDRHKIMAAVFLILQRDDKILLLRRFNTGWQDGNYSLVSGHIDGNEPFTLAMVREAKEEAGIDINPGDLQFAHIQHRSSPSDSREYVDMYFTVRSWQGEIQNMEPDKCDELEWYPLADLPSNVVPSVQLALESFINHRPYSEFGWQ